MPGPAVFFVGPGAVLAAKHMAWHAMHIASAADITTLTSASFAAYLFYWGFQHLPAWVKEDISFRNLLKNRTDVSKEELMGLFSVVEKLQHVAGNISELDTDIPQLHASLLAFIQLSGQIKQQQINQRDSKEDVGQSMDTEAMDGDDQFRHSFPQTTTTIRDSLYETAGKALDISTLRSDEIQNALRMATFAYYEDSETLARKLDERNFTMLHHKLVVRPGRVAHYIAVSPTKREVVVGLRGTSTLSDFCTDCCGRAVPFVDDSSLGDKVRVEIKAAEPITVLESPKDGIVEVVSGHERIELEDHDNDGDNFTRCHEGILISARNVMDEIRDFLYPLIECQYRIVFCGHSLGAGTAVVCAILLRSKYPEIFLKPNRIHVYAFGAPPVLDHDTAIAAHSYCTSIVNNSDLISRLNISNLAVSLSCLRKIQSKLAVSSFNPTGPVSSMTFLNKLSEGTSGNALMTSSELDQTICDAHKNLTLRKPEHLFVPGRVLLVYDPWLNERKNNCSTVYDGLQCVQTNGTSAVFQRLEIDGLRCLTDHLTSSYFEILGMDYEF
mmetsp:Transcript_66536/g.74532  ORF Transcript_66536/g.74532 Transcript_66536/m.74532 type:complete len:555 (+) Transcript_66536:169-1833(+)|eukprot:CAMPEP_0170842190 /NCGR_PEP_ID=MMETSP0734-20130129/5593_1 /TAXON_ID=186038 /ORGANISM="Fragilariopsis kerguelensis, Strain L26-C5" /LENGTH=554 /DNA_ID=CAMNT_0011210277 /DNA_START=48 /DNA_END=1712 /DNA_ORIENTATION=+